MDMVLGCLLSFIPPPRAEDYDHKWMHRNITIVSQEPVLFAQSIYNNIVYGLENVCCPAAVPGRQASAQLIIF
jgi:ABC-type multidrug transport system fused ATPase/permease subunit